MDNLNGKVTNQINSLETLKTIDLGNGSKVEKFRTNLYVISNSCSRYKMKHLNAIRGFLSGEVIHKDAMSIITEEEYNSYANKQGDEIEIYHWAELKCDYRHREVLPIAKLPEVVMSLLKQFNIKVMHHNMGVTVYIDKGNFRQA